MNVFVAGFVVRGRDVTSVVEIAFVTPSPEQGSSVALLPKRAMASGMHRGGIVTKTTAIGINIAHCYAAC